MWQSVWELRKSSPFPACRHIFNYLTEEEKKIVKDLGYRLTFELQRGMVIPPNALVASIVLQHLQGLHIGEPFDLLHRMTWVWPDLASWPGSSKHDPANPGLVKFSNSIPGLLYHLNLMENRQKMFGRQRRIFSRTLDAISDLVNGVAWQQFTSALWLFLLCLIYLAKRE